jgi:hypothetical protein
MTKQTAIVGVLVPAIVCLVMVAVTAHPVAAQLPQIPTETQCVADERAWYLDSANDDKRPVIELQKLLLEMSGCSKYRKHADMFNVSSDMLANELVLRYLSFMDKVGLTEQFLGKGVLEKEAGRSPQVPTEKQCIADVRAWDAKNGRTTEGELRSFLQEMTLCGKYPKHAGLFFALSSEASMRMELDCEDFIDRHELRKQFLEEDLAAVQERIAKSK